MELTKLPGLSIVITLSFQSILILGDTYLAPETSKETGLKLTEKRMKNFRVPMEMPYDPNFWPARGRRSRRDPEKTTQTDDCFTDDKIQCQDATKIHEGKQIEGKPPQLEFEMMPAIDLTDELLTSIERTESSCFGNGAASRLLERPKGRSGVKFPEILDERFLGPKLFDEIRNKKHKHGLQPQLIFYGNGVYWEPDNLFGEKKKKQDVFWVARGKKNFNLNYPQN